MKKSLLALAVLGAYAGVASAQSSVTLFGVVDIGYNYVDNDTNKIHRLANDQISNSRFGVRGVEDLGGGLKAGFWLESALSADNGGIDSTRFWGRRATASLLGGFGEIRLGRDFTPTYTSWADYAVFGTNGSAGSNTFNTSGAASVLTSGAGTATRADNQVSYFLPSGIGGVIGQFSASAGEGVAGNKLYGGRIGYAAGPISAQVGYSQTEVAAVLGDDTYVRWTLGASYDAGVVKVMAYYIDGDFANRSSQMYELGVSVPVGQGVIRAAYHHVKIEAPAVTEADKFGIGYIHNLSKRTAIYTTLALIDNDQGTYNVANNGASQGQALQIPNPPAGGKSMGFDLGIRHNF
jgi:predicted porin